MNDQPNLLDLSDESDAFVSLRHAVVVPPCPDSNSRESRSGVLDAQGQMVAQSISWTSSSRAVNSAPSVPTEGVRDLPGRYAFGGIFYGHFGHFIVESLARLWVQDAVDGRVDGMIFTPKTTGFPDKAVQKLAHLARPLGLHVPVIVANHPLRVEELIVPKQGFGMGDLSRGSRAFRDFMNAHAGASIIPTGSDRLYISRSKLPPMRGSILGEERIEDYLVAEGYDIFHPQMASIEEQIARYKAAQVIVGVDCSPIHLLGYVGSGHQRVAILSRRSMEISEYLVEQLRSFKGMQPKAIDALVNDWMPQPGNRPSRTSFGEADFGLLHARLLASGFIDNPTPWVSLTKEERATELAKLEATHETHFIPHR